MRIHNENFEHVISMMFYGYKASSHNPECFSSSDLRIEMWAEACCNDIINKMRDQGYDPALIVPVISKPEIDLKYYPDANPALKQELDDEFGGFVVNNDLYMLGLRAWYADGHEYISQFGTPCDDENDGPFGGAFASEGDYYNYVGAL
ncbi:hypothetical protein TCA2_4489 [Paenibacillus sp. TCA20]|uniref:Uncharacterized protein n=1 Tax=Paenibacillus urinalis TaxID=521520 RepID=A0ABY7XH91_9BACL|nr:MULTISPECIES: hypothetical protein [Paenibacillus]WDI05176.1 hypothetical protein PUW25_25545 [Paenibacillus urinalis]GAK41997.1 hypothetical protein TCA2_4489 [Paenibacillus sp. TCA20]